MECDPNRDLAILDYLNGINIMSLMVFGKLRSLEVNKRHQSTEVQNCRRIRIHLRYEASM